MTLQSFDGKNDTITPEQVQYWDQKHLIHPWSEFSENSFDLTQVKKAKGIYLYDGYGNKLIDGPGGMWCVNICLLYTSPSPRDRTRSRMPSSA